MADHDPAGLLSRAVSRNWNLAAAQLALDTLTAAGLTIVEQSALAASQARVERLEAASSELLNACIADFGLDDGDGDNEPVGGNGTQDGQMAIRFGHMRRLLAALAPDSPRPEGAK